MTYSGDWTSFEKGFIPRPLAVIGKLKTGDCKKIFLSPLFLYLEASALRRMSLSHPANPVRLN